MTQWKDPAAARREKAWRILRPIAATLLSVVLVAVAMIGAVRYVLSHFISPVDADDNTLYAEDLDQPDDAPVRLATPSMADAAPTTPTTSPPHSTVFSNNWR